MADESGKATGLKTQDATIALTDLNVDRSIMSFEEIANIATKRAAIFDKTTAIALSKLNKREIIDFGGTPYIDAYGCEKIARYFGVSWKLLKPEREDYEDDQGKYYIFTVEGEFGFGKERREPITAFGRCSTRDKFFARVTEYVTDPETGERLKKAVLRPQSEVDICNVMGKAQSNTIHTGVTMLLGLRGLTWEDIDKLSPGLRGDVGKVEFDQGGDKKGRTDKKGSTVKGGATEKQRKMIYAVATAKGVKDVDVFCLKHVGCKRDAISFEHVNELLSILNKIGDDDEKGSKDGGKG